MNILLASSFEPLTHKNISTFQILNPTGSLSVKPLRVTMWTSPRLEAPAPPTPLHSRDTCRQSACTNTCTKKLLSLWLQPQPHLQCNWVGCGKEISLCRVWTGNHCSGFESPTPGFVDLSLDHISSLVLLHSSGVAEVGLHSPIFLFCVCPPPFV